MTTDRAPKRIDRRPTSAGTTSDPTPVAVSRTPAVGMLSPATTWR